MEILEEKLREAACTGDRESLEILLKENVNLNSRNKINGWTALHWACKRGHEDIARILLTGGADRNIVTFKNETVADVCSSSSILNLLGSVGNNHRSGTDHYNSEEFVPNNNKNPPQVDTGRPRIKHSNISNMPTTMLPSIRDDALEHWFYENFNFKTHNILMLWQSDPCVVIGRHQNPYVEANVCELEKITKRGVTLARRNSGGGTVYHDNGNLNLTFFTTKECYSRKYNLEIITRAVLKECEIDVHINKKEDIIVDEYKVSGTAAKLGRPNAYHHCTLLVNVNKDDLSKSLKKMDLDIITNATKSVRSKIMNLTEMNPNISMDSLMRTIAVEYMRTPAFRGKNKETFHNIPLGLKEVDPSNEEYPGLDNIRQDFSSWKWVYGKTPKFKVKYQLSLSECVSDYSEVFNKYLEVVLTVENGLINKIEFGFPEDFYCANIKEDADSMLKNKVFDLDSHRILEEIVKKSLKSEISIVL